MSDEPSIRDLVDSFVRHKRAQGYAYGKRTASIYYQLARFLEERKVPDGPLAGKEAVLEWVSSCDGAPRSVARRAAAARALCSFLAKRGYEDCYIFPAELSPPWTTDFVPHIFTRDEIRSVIECADRMGPSRASPYRGMMFAAMIRVLYGCGLRVGEARHLLLGDVDLENGVLYVRNSKNSDSRMVPMDESLVLHLRKYLECGPPGSDDPRRPLFPSPRGGLYGHSAVERALRQCIVESGVRARGGGIPRIHDVRHTFAVHSLMNAAERGESAHSFLPALATYMGHKHIKCAEYYLHLTGEAQDAMIDKMVAAYGDTIYKEAIGHG